MDSGKSRTISGDKRIVCSSHTNKGSLYLVHFVLTVAVCVVIVQGSVAKQRNCDLSMYIRHHLSLPVKEPGTIQ